GEQPSAGASLRFLKGVYAQGVRDPPHRGGSGIPVRSAVGGRRRPRLRLGLRQANAGGRVGGLSRRAPPPEAGPDGRSGRACAQAASAPGPLSCGGLVLMKKKKKEGAWLACSWCLWLCVFPPFSLSLLHNNCLAT
ncbi:unnamed protein product, partial [Heterosigma akashiwo]